MDNVREKLVEVFAEAARTCIETDCSKCRYLTTPLCVDNLLIDHLIANGVTVQEWIPVSERLPEDSATVHVCHKNGFVTTNAWLGANWWFKNERNPITHWMPLPQPPKGDSV